MAEPLLAGPSTIPVQRIQARTGWLGLGLADLWRHRDLLYSFVWRDARSRYRQTLLGASWAFIRPVLTMLIFTVVFGRLLGVQKDVKGHYQLFVFSGNLPWLYFASAVGVGASSVLSNANLVTKTYFPRLLIPLAAIVAPLIDFLFSFLVFLGLFLYYREWPTWHIVFLPLFLLLVVNAALGLTLLMAPIVVRWRDINFVLPFVLQLWMYATPIIYPIEKIPQRWRFVVALNPLTGVIDGFRWCTQSGMPLHAGLLALSVAVSCVVTFVGLVTFRRGERRFADVI